MTDAGRSDAHLTERIADALVARQGLSRPKATKAAHRIWLSGEDIAKAAAYWADNDVMPDNPEIEGHTPAELSRSLRPSQVFTALAALRQSPELARETLKSHPSGSPADRARDWDAKVRQCLDHIPGVQEIQHLPLGPDRRSRPDFVVSYANKRIVIEAKYQSASLRRGSTIDQVERLVLLFEAHGGLIVAPDVPDAAPGLGVTTGPSVGYLALVQFTTLDNLAQSLERIANTSSHVSP